VVKPGLTLASQHDHTPGGGTRVGYRILRTYVAVALHRDMDVTSVRDLRNDTGGVLRRVQAGETLIV
jgi:hypothetical protein